MLIWQLEVNKWMYTRKEDWLEVTSVDEPFDYIIDDEDVNYTIYFKDFSSMSKHIDEITIGHKQFWANTREQTDGDVEELEYHNGSKWDSEIHLTTKQVRIHESLIEAAKELI